MEKGVWIDSRTAFIVSLSDDGINTSEIRSDIEEHERFEGEGKTFGRFGDQFLDKETTKERRHDQQVQDFLGKVMHELTNARSIVLFGPASMKVELEKAIKQNNDIDGKLEVVANADSMSENQKVAWVREFFGKEAPRREWS